MGPTQFRKLPAPSRIRGHADWGRLDSIGSIVLFVLARSPPLGRRPTMGRRERRTNGCSFWADFLQSTAHA